MMMPKSLAAWCTALFFLWYGLGVFCCEKIAQEVLLCQEEKEWGTIVRRQNRKQCDCFWKNG